MSSIPETLRELAHTLRGDLGNPDLHELLCVDDAAACDAGARSVEFVEAFLDYYGDEPAADADGWWGCSVCHSSVLLAKKESFAHDPECLYVRARSLLHGSPQP